MRSKVLLLVLALLILSAISAGSWFYISGNKILQTTSNQQTTATAKADVKDQTVTNGKSGVFGRVLVGPTCPLYQPDPPPQCQDKPTQAEIIVITQDRSQEVGRIKTDKDGIYKIALAPGTYILEPGAQKTGIARGMPQPITIEANKFVELNLYYDSGIR